MGWIIFLFSHINGNLHHRFMLILLRLRKESTIFVSMIFILSNIKSDKVGRGGGYLLPIKDGFLNNSEV